MNEEENNRNTKIEQNKGHMWRGIIICLAVILVFSLIFWAVTRNSTGTEINMTEFQAAVNKNQVKEIYFNNGKVQIYYINNEAHWMYYDRGGAEEEQIFRIIDTHYVGENADARPTIQYGTTTTISIMNILYPVLMIGSLIVILVIIMRSVRGANNKSFDFVKNRARIYPSKTKFTDVAGADEEKAELEDVVDFLKNPKKYVEMGAKIPKGVLLVGPPGTGKTLLARAVAGEANVPFFTISGSDFMELFVGVGASRVRDLFETAKKAKPCIIFIDEIDAVGRQRGAGLGGGNDEREQTLNQLLVQMDGFEDNEGIIVMAATNRVDILDPALLRPGRFDRRVNISIPDIKGREEIFKVHARNKPIDENVDIKTIARITSGFTGAEIENLLNEAAILVAKENRKKITTEDLQRSIMKVTLGPQKKSRVIDEKDKYDTAIHESGHALISKLAKEKTPVQEVSIIPRGGAGGYTLSADDDSTVYFREKLLCKIQMLLGGATAEKLYVGDLSTGASNDLKRASELARRMVTEWGMSSEVGMMYCGSDSELFLGRNYQERVNYSETQATIIDNEIKKIIDTCQKTTEKLLKDNKSKLLTMANVLLEKETIYEEEVDMILAGKSKEEVIAHIEGRKQKKEAAKVNAENAKTTENSAKNDEKTDNNDEKSNNNGTSMVDELLKKAEKIESEKANKDSQLSSDEKKLLDQAGEMREIASTLDKVDEQEEKAAKTKKTASKSNITKKSSPKSNATKKSSTKTGTVTTRNADNNDKK